MPDEFVKLVEFQATGLDKIETGLKSINAVQKLLTSTNEQYQKSLKTTTRNLSDFTRIAKTETFRQRVRETDELGRSQDRLNRLLERQQSIARYGRVGVNAAHYGGMVGGPLGAAGAGIASAGIGLGISGLQGTVPMARFSSALERLAYEMGNTLTPVVDTLTKKLQGASNWMSRRTEGEQNAIGYGTVGVAGLAGANLLSRSLLGAGIGTIGAGAIGAGVRGVGGAFTAGRMGLLGAAAGVNMAYGMGGIGGAAGAIAGGLGGVGAAVGVGAAPLALGFNALRSKYLVEESMGLEAGYNKGERKGTEGFASEYSDKFGSMEGNQRSRAIREELGIQLMRERMGVKEMAGGIFGSTSTLNDAQARQAVLRDMMNGKNPQGVDHRANAMTGGDFGEIGSGYYSAASALGKSGMDQAEGGGKADAGAVSVLQALMEMIRPAVEKVANPLH